MINQGTGQDIQHEMLAGGGLFNLILLNFKKLQRFTNQLFINTKLSHYTNNADVKQKIK